jgi:nucleotide-binding universal stress UspA family protein
MEMIVVGIDGSEGGVAALEFAADEAALRKARLRIVVAWELPVATDRSGFGPPLDPAVLDAVRARAEQVGDDAAATAKERQASLEVEAVAGAGQPADVLLAQGGDAELIVVGRRGLGGFKSLLLGSVSQQVVHYATCPVVVVNEPATRS